MSDLIWTREATAPATPSANKHVMYYKSDGLLYQKNDAGVETLVGGASAETLGTSQALTSGTFKDFAVPAGLLKFTVIVDSMGLSSTGVPILQLGTAGAFASSGYTGSNSLGLASSTSSVLLSGSGVQLVGSSANTLRYTGKFECELVDATTDLWNITATFGTTDVARIAVTVARIDLTAPCTRARLTTIGGTDTFTSGTANHRY